MAANSQSSMSGSSQPSRSNTQPLHPRDASQASSSQRVAFLDDEWNSGASRRCQEVGSFEKEADALKTEVASHYREKKLWKVGRRVGRLGAT